MEFTADLDLTKAYFSEYFEQWLTHRSKLRKWEGHIGLLVVGLGIGLMWFKPSIVSALVIVFGISQIIDFFLYRRN